MSDKAMYVIEGRLRCAEDAGFAYAVLAVHAFVDGKEVGAALVDKTGAYKLAFEGGKTLPSVELRLVPARLKGEAAEFPGLVETVSPLCFAPTDHGAEHHANMDIYVPKQLLIDLHWATRTCRIHGTVYAHSYLGPTPLAPDKPLPGARLDFYEVNKPLPTASRYVGTAFTARDGGYDFTFDLVLLRGGGKLDIKVRISQFRDGAWSQVYESMTDWDVSENFVKNYLVLFEDVYFPPTAAPLSNGFRPVALGLLPLDADRISDGYATSKGGEPIQIAQLSHQPFCETLRIFGLFGTDDQVEYYKVKVTPAKKDSVTGTWISATGEWEDVVDPLNNLEWDEVKKRWEPQVLGPDPEKHMYWNIPYKAEADWFEYALRVTWNSANKPDGYYLLKIVPCNDQGVSSGHAEYILQVLRVDNTLPQAALVVKSPAPTECGGLTLPADGKITFSVTAYSAAGHIDSYTLSGKRGLHDDSAGGDIKRTRGGDLIWTGVFNQEEVFTVDTTNNSCPVMAYHFQLIVQGSATNGYSTTLDARKVWQEMNLVVSV